MFERIKKFFRRQTRRITKPFSKFDKEEKPLTKEKILQDMEKLKPKFDLRDAKWRENPQAFLDEFFDPKKKYTSNDIRVPERVRDWLIGQCLLPNSRIWYYPRPEKVEVRPIDLINDYNGPTRIVTQEWRNYKGNVYEIKPHSLQAIKVTGEHPFYIVRVTRKSDKRKAWVNRNDYKITYEGWVEAKDLQKGDFLVIPKQTNTNRQLKLIGLKAIKRCNNLGQTSIVLNEDTAYFLGWYVAEGSCNENEGHINLTLNVEKDPVNEIGGIIRKIGYSPYSSESMHRGKSVTLQFKSIMFARWLRENVGKDARTKRIPKIIFESSDEIKRAFIRGYVSGDGYISDNGIRISTASEDLWYDLTYLFISLGVIPVTYTIYKKERMLEKRLLSPSTEYCLRISPNIYKEKIDSTYKTKVRKIPIPHIIEEKDRFLISIADIEKSYYEGKVYNVETETHTFLAPFLTHNSEALNKVELLKIEWMKQLKLIQVKEKMGLDYSRILREHPPVTTLLVGEPGCLVGNTRVVLNDGRMVRLEDLGKNHLQEINVGMLNGNGEINYAKVFHKYDNQRVIKIILKDGREILGTPNHPLMTNTGWKRLDEIKVGDNIKVIRKISCNASYVKVNFEHKMQSHLNGNSFTLESWRIPEEYNENLAWLFGYYLADGNADGTKVHFYVVDNEKELIEEIVKKLQETFAISPRIFLKSPRGENRTHSMYHITYYSVELSQFFGKKQIPEWLWESPDSVVSAFLRGLFDGDGYIGGSKELGYRITLKQKDKTVIQDVQLLLLRFGIRSTIVKSDEAFQLIIFRNDMIKIFDEQIGFTVKHKRDFLKECVAKMIRHTTPLSDYEEVVSIEESGYETVYDVEIPNGHEFIANGVVSHNTGKSLLIKILNEEMKEDYKREGIELNDVVLVEDKTNKHGALVRYLPAGIGRRIVEVAKIRETMKRKRRNIMLFTLLGGIAAVGLLLMLLGLRQVILDMLAGVDLSTALAGTSYFYFFIGSLLFGAPVFALIWLTWLNPSQMANWNYTIPNLIVDNTPGETEMFENVTVVNRPMLFGDIGWDPWQSGGLGTPAYLRASAGAIHKSHKKGLYIDELKNLDERSAIELLTILEDGECPIRHHDTLGTSGTTAMILETPPIKCVFWLIAACNLDLLFDQNSILNRIPALRDRFENYGDIIYFKDEVEASPLNQMLVCQVIRDEIYRFNLPPMEAQGFKLIIDLIKQRASSVNKLKFMFRQVIKVIRKSAQLAWKEGDNLIREKHVRTAIEHYISAVEQQLYNHEIEKGRPYRIIEATGTKYGVVNGLAVVGGGRYNEGAGEVIQVQAWLTFVDKTDKADYIVTGIGDEKDIEDSVNQVRTAIMRLYGIDIQKQCYTHVHFSQSRVEGPSAGITMTLAIMSLLGDPREFNKRKRKKKIVITRPIPIRQDIAVTGALEVRGEKNNNDVLISAIGGVDAKLRGAEKFGIKCVLMPQENYENSIPNKDIYKVKIVGCRTILDYFDAIRGDTDENQI